MILSFSRGSFFPILTRRADSRRRLKFTADRVTNLLWTQKLVDLWKFSFNRWEAEVCLCVLGLFLAEKSVTLHRADLETENWRNTPPTCRPNTSSHTHFSALCTCFNNNKSERGVDANADTDGAKPEFEFLFGSYVYPQHLTVLSG